VTVVLGLLAAVLYGVSDFAGGVASRRHQAATVLLYSEPIGVVLVLALVPFAGGQLTARAAAFGALGGLGGVAGVLVLYTLMTVAPINVVSPVTAVLASVVPVAIAFGLGERPAALAWAGIALGLVAVVLVSLTSTDSPHGRVGPRILALAVLSGVGFGLYFVFLGKAGDHTGLWPLAVSRLTGTAVIVPVAFARRAVAPVRGRMLGVVTVVGAFDALANLCFLEASRHGLLSVASVLTSLYPATTVLLAMTLLRERASATQRVGLALAAAAVVMITV